MFHLPTGFWGMGEWHSRAWLCGCVIWSWGQVPFPGHCSQTGRSPRQVAPACHLEVKYLSFSQLSLWQMWTGFEPQDTDFSPLRFQGNLDVRELGVCTSEISFIVFTDPDDQLYYLCSITHLNIKATHCCSLSWDPCPYSHLSFTSACYLRLSIYQTALISGSWHLRDFVLLSWKLKTEMNDASHFNEEKTCFKHADKYLHAHAMWYVLLWTVTL